MDAYGAAKDIIMEAINIAKEEVAIEETRLGRRLTDTEVGNIAKMVERQFQTALAIAKL